MDEAMQVGGERWNCRARAHGVCLALGTALVFRGDRGADGRIHYPSSRSALAYPMDAARVRIEKMHCMRQILLRTPSGRKRASRRSAGFLLLFFLGPLMVSQPVSQLTRVLSSCFYGP